MKTSLYELQRHDVLGMFLPDLESKDMIIGFDGKLRFNHHDAIEFETPWIHVNSDPDRKCKWYQRLFMRASIIPQKCLNCWKVVAKPQTLTELFGLLEVQEDLDRWSKCGIERREYTPGLYGGYFYNNSYDEGIYCRDLVRKAVKEHVGDMRVYLKRFCTEFELANGPSNNYRQSPADAALEREIEALADIPRLDIKQPDFLKNHIKKKWILFAAEHGDPTANDYNGKKPIITPCVEYD